MPVHINRSGEIEQVCVEMIAATAAKLKLQCITCISATSLAEENARVPLIRRKYFSAQAIRESGDPKEANNLSGDLRICLHDRLRRTK